MSGSAPWDETTKDRILRDIEGVRDVIYGKGDDSGLKSKILTVEKTHALLAKQVETMSARQWAVIVLVIAGMFETFFLNSNMRREMNGHLSSGEIAQAAAHGPQAEITETPQTRMARK
jgi:hypothetical protein